jgi:hypothetical protein
MGMVSRSSGCSLVPQTSASITIELDAVVYFAAGYGFPVNVLGRHGWIERL